MLPCGTAPMWKSIIRWTNMRKKDNMRLGSLPLQHGEIGVFRGGCLLPKRGFWTLKDKGQESILLTRNEWHVCWNSYYAWEAYHVRIDYSHSAMHKNTRILNAAISIEHTITIDDITIISDYRYNSYILNACWMLQLFFPIHFPPKRSRIFRFSLSSCDFPRVKHLLLWGKAFSPATPSSLPGTNWFQPRYPPLVSTSNFRRERSAMQKHNSSQF